MKIRNIFMYVMDRVNAVNSPEVRRMILMVYFRILFPITFTMVFVSKLFDRLLGLPFIVQSPANIILGVLSIIIGLLMVGWCYSYLNLEGKGSPVPGFKKTVYLLTAGPYALSRHPSVLGKLMGVIGLAFLFKSSFFLFVTIPLLLIGSIFEKKYRQEPVDLQMWGATYIDYQRRVPILFPGPGNIIAFFRNLKNNI